MRSKVDFPQPEGPDQDEEFFIFDFEVGIVNGNDVAVPFGHLFQRNPGHNTLLLKI